MPPLHRLITRLEPPSPLTYFLRPVAVCARWLLFAALPTPLMPTQAHTDHYSSSCSPSPPLSYCCHPRCFPFRPPISVPLAPASPVLLASAATPLPAPSLRPAVPPHLPLGLSLPAPAPASCAVEVSDNALSFAACPPHLLVGATLRAPSHSHTTHQEMSEKMLVPKADFARIPMGFALLHFCYYALRPAPSPSAHRATCPPVELPIIHTFTSPVSPDTYIVVNSVPRADASNASLASPPAFLPCQSYRNDTAPALAARLTPAPQMIELL